MLSEMLKRRRKKVPRRRGKNQNGKLIINWTRLKNRKASIPTNAENKNRYQLPLADLNQIRKAAEHLSWEIE